MKAKFESKGDTLYINGKKVLKGWESFSGWYWFAVELVQTQDSDLGGTIIKDDKIWYGYVQGQEEEWGEFSQGEIESLGKHHVWKIPQNALSYSGRRD